VKRGGPARPIGDSVRGALRSLGVPSRAASSRVRSAWGAVADPAWAGLARPLSLSGGVLSIGVSSSALRHDLAQYHAARLLEALRRTLHDEPIVSLRFEPDPSSVAPAASPGDRAGSSRRAARPTSRRDE
jgi:hypothetical protein